MTLIKKIHLAYTTRWIFFLTLDFSNFLGSIPYLKANTEEKHDGEEGI